MRIGINGTGVAGPTLAYWLRHFGHTPVLFEKAPALRTGGYLIDFWGHGYDVAEKMGLLPALHERGYRMDRLVFVDAAGSPRARMDMNPMREMIGDRLVSLPRGDIAASIFDACEGVEARFGVSVREIEQRRDEARVTLSDGSEERFDLVVGADGLHSRIREAAFVGEGGCVHDLGCYVAAFRLRGYGPRDELTFVSHTRPGRQVGRISLRDDRTLVLMIFRSKPLAPFPADPEGVKAALREAYVGMGWEVSEILARLDEVDEIYFDRVCQIRLNAWTAGRVALVGDAAACVSLLAGEGTGLAMTEAYVLAGELHRNGGDHEAAFRAYEDRLRGFLRGKQKSALRNVSFFVPRSGVGVRVRDWLVGLGNRPFFARRFVAAVLEDGFILPDYDSGSPASA